MGSVTRNSVTTGRRVVGTAADNLVQLDANARLPALDARNIIGLQNTQQPAGGLVQVAQTTSTATATGTTLIPLDDTIPQITEGDEYMTLAITPTSATNILEIDVCIHVSSSVVGHITAALFQGSTANALAAATVGFTNNNFLAPVIIRHRMTAGTTSATTFRVRAGLSTAGTARVNGISGRLFGGVFTSFITIREIKA